MKKHIVIISVFILCCIFTVTSVQKNNNIENTDTAPTEYIGYTVKESNGLLAVYKNGTNKPIKVYNIQINSLPESDKVNLKKGIFVETEKELNQLINDFTS